MKTFEPFTQVVHKAYASEPMIVLPEHVFDANGNTKPGAVQVRRAVQTQNGVQFDVETFYAEELETPIESIEREAEIFKALNAKKDEINGSSKRLHTSGNISQLN